ncbi:MAG: DNA-directed RNA polymerase subunit beta', partial [Spirochaetaceae bacterium]|nr:DNA-directed RNA polymerase subunit beta' [Spirochaetaceae bacterium]
RHPITGDIIIDMNEEITEPIAAAIEAAGIESVRIRTVLTCEAKYGVCKRCYGRNLATNHSVDVGEAVGTIAAQSIGQPGTQLTMRTFHIGGAATTISEDNRVFLKYPVYMRSISGAHVVLGKETGDRAGRWLFTRKGQAVVNKIMKEYKVDSKDEVLIEDGQRVSKGLPILRRGGKDVCASENAYAMLLDKKLLLTGQDQKIELRNGCELEVKAGDIVEAEKSLATFDPFSDPIIAEADGTVQYEYIIEGSTLKEEIDEETGNVEKRIMEFHFTDKKEDKESKKEDKSPRINIIDDEGNVKASYPLPSGAVVGVDDGEKIPAGRTIAKTLKESTKALDITSGLPRVGELFEARKPRIPAVLAQISGKVHFKGIVKGKRLIIVQDAFGKEFKHLIPMTKRLLVRDGDEVEAGEYLCDGVASPHDILHIHGENALQRYLMDEIQKVYRLQGVSINDKHIGVIIRQMMRKVEIVAVGDTRFIFGQLVDKYRFHEENERVLAEGGQASVGRPVFQGITKASLNIDSFLSAASFQETTRVLTNAAIAESVDGLRGLKENIIIGHPIPAGTGMKKYQNIKLFDEESQDLDQSMREILEKRRLEAEEAAEALNKGEPQAMFVPEDND